MDTPMEQHKLLVYPKLVIGLKHDFERVVFDAPLRMFTYGDLRKTVYSAFKWTGRLEQYSMHVYVQAEERRCNAWDAFDSCDVVFFTFGTVLPVAVMYEPEPRACGVCCVIA